MKKALTLLMTLALFVSLFAMSGLQTESCAEAAAEVPETTLVRWNYGTSGNVLVTVALEKGYFKEYGIDLEIVEATQNAGAMQLLSSGKVDIVSNAGTSNPLQQIASGVDMTIFGGHMVTGHGEFYDEKGRLCVSCMASYTIHTDKADGPGRAL